MRYLLPALTAFTALSAAACGTRSGPSEQRPARNESFARPLEIYHDLGFITGTGQFPAVASFSAVAGPADSTWVLVGMSMPGSAIRFQRDGNGFYGEYRLDVTFMDQDSNAVRRFDAREIVRVSTFAETGRTDESIVFQQGITVQPGHYIVRVHASDVNSSRGFRTTDTLTVPDFASAPAIASPILVYQAEGRVDRDVLPVIVANPRNTVAYGGARPVLYLESYRAGPAPLSVRIVDEVGATRWSADATLHEGSGDLRYGTVEIPAEDLPLGTVWAEVSAEGISPVRAPIVMSISDQWMVANLEDITEFLRFISYPEELDSLQTGTPAERRASWDRFWERRDPFPVTEINEYREQFFQRVRYATEAFREPGGRAGWDTDRGEVYIVLGPPDHAIERYMNERTATGQPNAEEWTYAAVPGGRLTLLFYDRAGFGRFELVPSSASSFRSVADRMKRRLQPR